MALGLLYESKEWSSYALRDYIEAMGVAVKFIDMQENISGEELLSCDLIVNRVFASSVFRGHHKSLDQMLNVIYLTKTYNIPMINPIMAHFYEISKFRSTEALAVNDFPVPRIYGVYPRQKITDAQSIKYPCIIKPDCGGRTNYTYIVRSHQELCDSMQTAPDISFLAEEYINPEYGYLTRIEVIGRCCRSILKRSVADNGLSAYHLGSTYEAYDDCSDRIKNTAIKAMDLLEIEAGSMDIIENQRGFFIIDINSVSNASQDNIEMFHFDLMKETAAYAVKRYMELEIRR